MRGYQEPLASRAHDVPGYYSSWSPSATTVFLCSGASGLIIRFCDERDGGQGFFPVLWPAPALPGLVPRLMSAHAFSAWSGWFGCGCGVPPGFYGFCRRCWCCGTFLRPPCPLRSAYRHEPSLRTRTRRYLQPEFGCLRCNRRRSWASARTRYLQRCLRCSRCSRCSCLMSWSIRGLGRPSSLRAPQAH